MNKFDVVAGRKMRLKKQMFIYSHHRRDERDFDKINRLKYDCSQDDEQFLHFRLS